MMEEKSVERRTKADIFFDILRIVQQDQGKTKTTRILYGANLSYARLKKYLDYLIQNNFLQKMEKNGAVYFVITEKGLNFIQEFRKVKRFSEAFWISI
jgi:predicted transcriptional regulator